MCYAEKSLVVDTGNWNGQKRWIQKEYLEIGYFACYGITTSQKKIWVAD